MTDLTLRSVRHGYRAVGFALEVPDIHLGPGVTGLIGVNGAGKSTLLRIASGGLRPREGTVLIDGENLYGPARRRLQAKMGLMPQSYVLPTDAKVRDAVAYVGWLKGLGARDARRAASTLLERVELADRSHSRVKALSGGMLRRLAFAQALVGDPSVLLLDEPTTGLDPQQRVKVRGLVADLQSDPDRGRAVLVSSHLMEDIEALASRVLVLDAGRVLFHDTLEEFRRLHPSGSAEDALLGLLTNTKVST